VSRCGSTHAPQAGRSRHACGTPRTGRAELRSSACPTGRRRRPFEQSLEPRRPNAVLDRTSTLGAKPTRLSSPSYAIHIVLIGVS